eukprot:10319-Chlamydomonas_euryale.AAC.1
MTDFAGLGDTPIPMLTPIEQNEVHRHKLRVWEAQRQQQPHSGSPGVWPDSFLSLTALQPV